MRKFGFLDLLIVMGALAIVMGVVSFGVYITSLLPKPTPAVEVVGHSQEIFIVDVVFPYKREIPPVDLNKHQNGDAWVVDLTVRSRLAAHCAGGTQMVTLTDSSLIRESPSHYPHEYRIGKCSTLSKAWVQYNLIVQKPDGGIKVRSVTLYPFETTEIVDMEDETKDKRHPLVANHPAQDGE